MLVKEFMTKDIVTCNQGHTVERAAKIMAENSYSALPIVDDQKHLTGIITESDFVGKEIEVPHSLSSIKSLLGQTFHATDIFEIYNRAKDTPLSKVMTKDVKTVSPNATLNDLVNIMMENNLKRLPVVENGQLVGIVTRTDILKAFTQATSSQQEHTAASV